MSSPKVPTVTRTPKTRGRKFARIDNASLQDRALSFRARGILGYIISMPSTWTHSAERLAAVSKEGVDSIRAALRELEAGGYAELRKVRSARGSWIHRWFFSESPKARNPDPLDQTKPRDLRDSEESGLGGKALGGMGVLETTIKETTIRETTKGGTEAAGTHPLGFVPLVLTTEDAADMAQQFGLEGTPLARVVDEFNAERRQFFRIDGPPTSAGLRAYVRKHRRTLGASRRVSAHVNPLDYTRI